MLQGAVAVGGLLAKMDTPAAIRLGDELQADELHSSRIVSLGSFSNAWVGRTTGGYRFIFSRGATDREAPRVVDQQDPSRRWVLNALFPAEPQTRDYAIITRTLPPLSAQPAISLAGLHSFGNFIAADFAVSESGWKAIAERAPAGWESMNLQIVLEADVVGTAVGPPRVLAAHFWR